jgi:hypothetical protein
MRNLRPRGLSWHRLIALSACALTIVVAVIAATVAGSASSAPEPAVRAGQGAIDRTD